LHGAGARCGEQLVVNPAGRGSTLALQDHADFFAAESGLEHRGSLVCEAFVAGLLQFTPTWAATNPADGKRSVPRNLDLPFDDPNNFFGQYVYQTVQYYNGQIDQWIVWNEPDFRPGDPGAGGSFTWLGSDEEFAQLMKVGYLAAKGQSERDRLVPRHSYWVDVNSNRFLYYDRIMAILAADPTRSPTTTTTTTRCR
jgi:hypothetical protein